MEQMKSNCFEQALAILEEDINPTDPADIATVNLAKSFYAKQPNSGWGRGTVSPRSYRAMRKSIPQNAWEQVFPSEDQSLPPAQRVAYGEARYIRGQRVQRTRQMTNEALLRALKIMFNQPL